jgi:hypothetical protein
LRERHEGAWSSPNRGPTFRDDHVLRADLEHFSRDDPELLLRVFAGGLAGGAQRHGRPAPAHSDVVACGVGVGTAMTPEIGTASTPRRVGMLRALVRLVSFLVTLEPAGAVSLLRPFQDGLKTDVALVASC